MEAGVGRQTEEQKLPSGAVYRARWMLFANYKFAIFTLGTCWKPKYNMFGYRLQECLKAMKDSEKGIKKTKTKKIS